MSETLTPNAQAALLLTAPLIAARGNGEVQLLTPSEYSRLVLRLREMALEPADLLSREAEQILGDCRQVADRARLERLLGRGFLLSQAVERWQARAIWVVSHADAAYPPRLMAHLKERAPAVLYGCGERTLLDSGGLAVVGSRHVDDALVEYTEEVGRLAARARRTIVSGGARGIDQAAMRGALEEGGNVIGVLADSLERSAMNREHRELLLDGRLVLISPYDPVARFNVGHAMQRNKYIYALADAALVVSAEVDEGGTWAGAIEQLRKLRMVPVYVRSTGSSSAGLDALRERGALHWPNPQDADGLEAALTTGVPETPSTPPQNQLAFDERKTSGPGQPAGEPPSPEAAERSTEPTPQADPSPASPAEEMFEAARTVILRALAQPKSMAELADELGMTQRQTEQWLKRLLEEGAVNRRTRPVRYVAGRQGRLQPGSSSPTTITPTEPNDG